MWNSQTLHNATVLTAIYTSDHEDCKVTKDKEQNRNRMVSQNK